MKVPQKITETIHPLQKIVSQPLGPNQTSYYKVLVKKGHSYKIIVHQFSLDSPINNHSQIKPQEKTKPKGICKKVNLNIH